MSSTQKNSPARERGAPRPGGRVDRRGKPLSPRMIPQGTTVCQVPVAAGGPIHWAACDGIFSLKHVLIERGIVVDDDRLAEAVCEAWQRMAQADYLSERDRSAWGEGGNGQIETA